MEKRPQDQTQTLVLIKPDALKNSLTGVLLSLFSEVHTGVRFAGSKVVQVSRMLAEEHYAEHKGKFFYEPLLEYIMGRLHYANQPWKRRVIAIMYQGPDAPRKIRDIAGPTNPHVAREQRPGCIRSLGTVVPVLDAAGKPIGERMDNLVHASANDADAEREIKLWFLPYDIPPLMRPYEVAETADPYYFKDGMLHLTDGPGRACLLASGDIAWKSDLDALKLLAAGKPATVSLASIAAKYLVNKREEE
jgi:nucleoside-diphosphate kinase